MPEMIEKMIEAAALAACKQINYSLNEEAKKNEFEQHKVYYTDVAVETLKGAFKELPDTLKEVETEARNMQLQCIKDNPTASTIPSIYHYECQLEGGRRQKVLEIYQILKEWVEK